MHPRARALIDTLALEPHPEGGHYCEVFRSPARVRGAAGERSALTAIYFLLAAGQQSRWHVVTADELWQFCEGEPVELLRASPDLAVLERDVVGPAGGAGQPLGFVPAGWWQAARPLGAYALVVCTVAPGFEFADFTLLADRPAEAARLRERFPELAALL